MSRRPSLSCISAYKHNEHSSLPVYETPTLAYSKYSVYLWATRSSPLMSSSWLLVRARRVSHRQKRTYPFPAAFCGLLRWNSISSTVHTAPFTFSRRTKHLWRLRLCLTAFCKIWRHEFQLNANKAKNLRSFPAFAVIPSMWLRCAWNMQSFSWTSCRFRLMSADCEEIRK